MLLLCVHAVHAQVSPAISSWLQNNTILGRHYVSGNSIPIQDADLVNVQQVAYSANWVYITTQGVPSYVTGPFLDGNPSITTAQNAIFKIPLHPTQNTNTGTPTSMGNIGQFINGVALFDCRDGVAWNPSTSALCGGPGNPPCPGGPNAIMEWNRDAILAEKVGFDCAKGHPAQGNYHHHQNPSAFKLDKNIVSTICNLYDADGLYVIDSTHHSPLIGFAYDGFPIYGAYAYKNTDGTGPIVRMKSSYQIVNTTTRVNGPAVSTTYPLGYFKEDYTYTPTSTSTPDFLDEHNGRFCKTPDYPNGIYCYFATVDENWNSAYPYVIGPTYYGVKTGVKVTSIAEPTTIYTPTATHSPLLTSLQFQIFPNPSADLLAIQIEKGIQQQVNVNLYTLYGQLVAQTVIYQGSTIAYFDTKTIYAGEYIIRITDGTQEISKKVSIVK